MSKRDTRLVNKAVLDDPDEILPAGSNEEADIIAEWTREELVETIQSLDRRLYKAETALRLAKQAYDLLKESQNAEREINKD